MELSPATSLASVPHHDVPAWVDRKAYPFSPRSFATTHGRMAYLDEGHGRPVVIVHGTPSWSFEWRHVIQSLANTRRCVVVDHLGFGLSDKRADAPMRPQDHAMRLQALMRELDLRELTLVVHDFGGPIGLPIALDMPERVAEVIVVNTWMWPNGHQRKLRRIDRLIRSGFGKWLYLGLNASPRWLLPAAIARKQVLTEAVHHHYLAPYPRRDDRHGLYALAKALVGEDAYYDTLWRRRQALENKPMRVVWGECDPAFGPVERERWSKAFPHAEVVRLADVGHFVAEEEPAALVAAIGRTGV